MVPEWLIFSSTTRLLVCFLNKNEAAEKKLAYNEAVWRLVLYL
jgi:hypothetical protein